MLVVMRLGMEGKLIIIDREAILNQETRFRTRSKG